MKKLAFSICLLLYFTATSTIILTAYINGYEEILENMTLFNMSITAGKIC